MKTNFCSNQGIFENQIKSWSQILENFSQFFNIIQGTKNYCLENDHLLIQRQN